MRKSETGPVRHRRGSTFWETEQTPIPHFYIYRIAKSALERGQKDDFQIATVFAAFTAEAYFNHLGQILIGYWNAIESIKVGQKAEILNSHVFGRAVSWGVRPYQSLAEAIDYRNAIAHGKTVTVSWRGLVSNRKAFAGPIVFWQRCRNRSVAARILKDVHAIVCELHTVAGQPDDPFRYSGRGHTVIVVPPDHG